MTTPTIQRVAAFGLTSRDAHRLSDFYQAAFDCRVLTSERLDDTSLDLPSPAQTGALQVTLILGRQTLEILQFDTPGRPYPEPLSPIDNAFQHFALVVSDMDAAWRRLQQLAGWTAISTEGPQRLPPSTGSVKAFKFRDPEGHPLEFLEFPDAGRPPYWNLHSGDLFLGIDHSALSVRNVQLSLDFYRGLGFKVGARTLNRGDEQQRLDGIADPQVDVIALESHTATPHVELLHYRTTASRGVEPLNGNDLAATRLVLETRGADGMVDGRRDRVIRDPDGHLLQLRVIGD